MHLKGLVKEKLLVCLMQALQVSIKMSTQHSPV